ncbi:MAG: hypothetical protein IPO08_22570 [Xanthomonadales bacterium]|nr:hypothetical protein [Xanthomonadales bacterium]
MIEVKVVAAVIYYSGELGPQAVVLADLSDGRQTVEIMTYYSDELTFTAEELVGLTWAQVRALHFERDKCYLQS